MNTNAADAPTVPTYIPDNQMKRVSDTIGFNTSYLLPSGLIRIAIIVIYII